MKKFLKTSLLFTVLFFFMFECITIAQLRRPVTPRSHLREYVIIKGGVHLFLLCENNKGAIDVRFNTLKLKPGSNLKIRGVSINGMNVPEGSNGKYHLYKSGFKCSAGDLLEVKVKLAKKATNSTRMEIIEVPVAKYRVRNRFKRYIFPTQGSVIDLSDYGDSLTFRWEFVSSTVESRVFLKKKAPSYSTVWMRDVPGASLKVSKDTLSSGMEYKIDQSAFLKSFSLTEAAHKD